MASFTRWYVTCSFPHTKDKMLARELHRIPLIPLLPIRRHEERVVRTGAVEIDARLVQL